VPEHVSADKVRVKRADFCGKRGILLRQDGREWLVSLHGGDTVRLPTEDFTNLSLAARRAWRRMPERKVGRPMGTKISDRVSVTFRIDRTLWAEFLNAEQKGFITERTNLINQCLRDVLTSIYVVRPKAS
jgi:hypothetical protein